MTTTTLAEAVLRDRLRACELERDGALAMLAHAGGALHHDEATAAALRLILAAPEVAGALSHGTIMELRMQRHLAERRAERV